MAKLAAAFASSHSVMLTCTLEDWQRNFREFDPKGQYYDRKGNVCSYVDLLERAPANARDLVSDEAVAQRYRQVHAAIGHLRTQIQDAKLDVLVICGDDQKELFFENLMPSIGIYYGDTIRNAPRKELPAEEWYKRAQMRRLEDSQEANYPVQSAMAAYFIEGLQDRGFDIAALKGLGDGQYEGHAYSFIHRTYLKDSMIPVVPIFLNTFHPPNQPSPKRCLQLGNALRELIESFPGDARVGFLASGGLSHFTAEEDLDNSVIDALKRKDFAALGNLDPKRLQSGSSEIRNWIVLGAAARDLDMRWVSYTPAYRTPALTGTGLAFASWH